jgi:hypothetical protein
MWVHVQLKQYGKCSAFRIQYPWLIKMRKAQLQKQGLWTYFKRMHQSIANKVITIFHFDQRLCTRRVSSSTDYRGRKVTLDALITEPVQLDSARGRDLFWMLSSLIRNKMIRRPGLLSLFEEKPGKNLNNCEPHLKHHKIYKMMARRTHNTHSRAPEHHSATKVHTKNHRIHLIYHEQFLQPQWSQRGGYVPLWRHEQRPKCSSDAPCMWRVVLQLIIAGHLHEPWVSLARFTSKIDSLKRNASSIA